MKIELIGEYISLVFFLNPHEYKNFKLRMSPDRAFRELCFMFRTKWNKQVWGDFSVENRLLINIAIDEVFRLMELLCVIEEIREVIEDFIIYISLLGYQPELPHANPLSIAEWKISEKEEKKNREDKEAGLYIFGTYKGTKFKIKKGD